MITTQLELSSLQAAQVDLLGRLLTEIAYLQKQAEEIKDSIKDLARTNGVTSYEGRLFKATYSESNRNSVDYNHSAQTWKSARTCWPSTQSNPRCSP